MPKTTKRNKKEETKKQDKITTLKQYNTSRIQNRPKTGDIIKQEIININHNLVENTTTKPIECNKCKKTIKD